MQKPVILDLNEPFYTSQISRKAVYYHVTLQILARPPKIQLETLEGVQSTAFDEANLISYILKHSIEPFPPNKLLTVITCHPNAVNLVSCGNDPKIYQQILAVYGRLLEGFDWKGS